MTQLILLRHGQSTWNVANLFTGWVDVDLSEQGVNEARQAGRLLAEAELLPDVLYTSLLIRAIRTAELALTECGRSDIPAHRSWRLNERHYGALQGLNKSETLQQYGAEQLQAWRRGYDTPPPAIEPGSEYDVRSDPRYGDIDPAELPTHESLQDVVARMLPYWHNDIVPDLQAGHTTFVVAHGNSLRALIKELEGLSDDEVTGLEIATGVPRVYDLDADLSVNSVLELGDVDAIAAAKEAVANQARQ